MGDPTKAFLFGSYRLIPDRRVLLHASGTGREVSIRSRPFDLLLALLERRDRVVPKDELLQLVWPGRVVEEGNLTVHIASLRKLLGNDVIATLPGRGYRFVAPVEETTASPSSTVGADQTDLSPTRDRRSDETSRTNLPVSTSSLIGREVALATVVSLLGEHRLVTLTGAGGIGKTRLSLDVGRLLLPHYTDGVWLVELGSLLDGGLVAGTVAAALDLDVTRRETSVDAVGRALRSKHLVLILDNCEHLIGPAASVAETIVRAGPGLRVLATSREPLRADGEHLYRLAPLQVTPPTLNVTVDNLRASAAAALFAERARAADAEFTLTSDDQARDIMAICRRLDGIPLAIELAAARAATFGIKSLVARLDDRFSFLTSGRRTALPRHQTLAATLDWSYQLLPEAERTLLRRLAVFSGDFPLEAAIALAPEAHPSEATGQLAELVSKSLVMANRQGDLVQYRLLETTRLYSLEKLRSAGELLQTRYRHAQLLTELFMSAEAEADLQPRAEWLGKYGRHLDNVRAALDWTFSPDGDAALGVALTIVVKPLWVSLSLLSECRRWVEQALVSLETDDAEATRSRMQLCAVLGWSLMYAVGRANEAGAAWTTTLTIAGELGDTRYHLRALWGLWIDRLNNGDVREALELAQQFANIATSWSDAYDVAMADRILATSLHYSGDQAHARLLIERAISQYAALTFQPHTARYQSDQRVTARYFKARILWLQGYPDQAVTLVENSVREVPSLSHALSFGSVLGQSACLIALFTGNMPAADSYGRRLLDHAHEHDLQLWLSWARCFIGLVQAKQGDTETGLNIVRSELERAGDKTALPRYLVLVGEFAACLGQAGDVALGLSVVEDVLARCERSGEGWYRAELVRIKGELVMLRGAPDATAAAEAHFRVALDCAQQQGAQAWALRAASSLARLWQGQGRTREATALLTPVHTQLTEGFDTADVLAANELLRVLRRDHDGT